MEEGLRVFIKVQLGLFSALIVLFAVVMYFAIHPMWKIMNCHKKAIFQPEDFYFELKMLPFQENAIWLVSY